MVKENLIRLETVVKTFPGPNGDVQALKGVSLNIPKGSIYGILGSSGAGKSTLIRVLNGLEKPTSGKIYIKEKDLGSLSKAEFRSVQQKIGMIFQHFNLVNALTVRDNVTLPLRLKKISKVEAEKKADHFLDLVGLSDKVNTYPSKLSGGQKQRVAIARALAMEPDLLLSDEATSALDPETKESILSLLKKINRELGITIVLITHELEVVQKICQRVSVMSNGNIAEEGDVFNIFSNPQSKITKSFLKSVFHEEVMPQVKSATDGAKGKYVRLSYSGPSSVKPALAEATNKFNITPNILSGIITELVGEPYGRLTVHLEGKEDDVNSAISYLLAEGVDVKEVSLNEYN